MPRRPAVSLLASCLCALPALADTAPVYLVRDIDTVPDTLRITSGGDVAVAGGSVFFEAYTIETGREVYRTDGTPEGTVLVKDIKPGPDSSFPSTFKNVNGTVFFLVDIQNNSNEVLWKTDGTAAGTMSLNVAPLEMNPNFKPTLTPAGNLLFFVNYTSAAGAELWKSDGTIAGTVLVKDIVPGTGSADPTLGIDVNGTLFFSANGGNGSELWKSDGTDAGTVLVKDINPGTGSSSPRPLAVVNGILFFTANDGAHGTELWKSDGTDVGTVLVKDLTPSGTLGSTFVNGVAVDGRLVFTASAQPGGHGIWRSDGTDAGTGQLYATAVSAGTLVKGPGAAYAGLNDGTHGFELWRSDGTVAGTALVKDILSGSGNGLAGIGIDVNGTLFVRADDGIYGSELWRTDGTETGTTLLKDIAPGSASSSSYLLADLGGTLLFQAYDGESRGFWTSDGTPEGTLKTVDPFAGTASSSPDHLTDVNGTIFFAARDVFNINDIAGGTGIELYKTDGSETGTVMVKDIFPGTTPNGANSSSPHDFCNLNGTLYFGVGVSGQAIPLQINGLWKSDGTPAGTVKVFSSVPGGDVGDLTIMNGMLYFLSAGGVWKSDGTTAGTGLLMATTSAGELTDIDGTLFFVVGYTAGSTPQLWKSDGTTAGTVFVKNLYSLPTVPFPIPPSSHELTNVNGTVFFEDLNPVSYHRELWKSDGTGAGTVLVKDFVVATRLTNLNGTLFFAGNDGTAGGAGLWKSDGTGVGTVQVGPAMPNYSFPNPFGTGSLPIPLTNAAGTLFYAATTPANGTEMWTSDGTQAGTVLVEDVVPGTGSLAPTSITAVGSRVVFTADVSGHSSEPWTSDGTAAGTHPIAEIAPTGGSVPDNFVLQGASVVFAAQNYAVGRELFAVAISALDDVDQDGLDDASEAAHGTDPVDADSDDDGLTDGAEVNTHGTNPLDADTDHDSLSDGFEIAHGTNPLDPFDPPVVPIPLWSLGALAALLLATATAFRPTLASPPRGGSRSHRC